MTESTNVRSAILDAKMDKYSWEEKNYVAEGELTVTITLSEYRRLISEIATKEYDIKKANEDKYKRDAENQALRNEVERLTKLFHTMQLNEVKAND